MITKLLLSSCVNNNYDNTNDNDNDNDDNNNINNTNDCISRAPFHVKHAQ